MSELTTPKVFLSYAWTNEKYRDGVAAFAQRLSEEGGIEVISDFWDIKPGQDMYKFMEASVHDNSITKVLILCNEVYAKKADDAEGGVGTETLIISPYVYERTDQVKYIPVPFLIDSEDPRKALPIYLKGRNYIDMSTPDKVESNFMTLVKWIYDKPEYSKPNVGSVPSYILDDDSSSPSTLELLKTAAAFKHKSSIYAAEIKKINDLAVSISEFLLKCRNAEPVVNTGNIRTLIDKITPARNYVLNAMENTIIAGGSASALLTATLQNIEDMVMVRSDDISLNDYSYQPYEFLVYEIILYSSALMLHYQAISELFDVLNQKFCLHEHYYPNYGEKIYSIVDLEKQVRRYGLLLDQVIIPPSGGNYYFPSTQYMINRCSNKGLYTSNTIAYADTMLCMATSVLFHGNYRATWYPMAFLYYQPKNRMFDDFWSAKYCNMIAPLFGERDVIGLRRALKEYPVSNVFSFEILEGNTRPILTEFMAIESVGSRY